LWLSLARGVALLLQRVVAVVVVGVFDGLSVVRL